MSSRKLAKPQSSPAVPDIQHPKNLAVRSVCPSRIRIPLKVATRYMIGGELFILTEIPQIIDEFIEARFGFTSIVSSIRLRLTVGDISALVSTEQMYPGNERPIVKEPLNYVELYGLSDPIKADIAMKIRYVTSLDRLVGQVSFRNKNGLFASIVAGIAESFGDKSPLHITTLYDLLRAYRNCGRDGRVFALRLALNRRRGPRQPELKELVQTVMMERMAQGARRPPIREIHEEVNKRYSALQDSKNRRS